MPKNYRHSRNAFAFFGAKQIQSTNLPPCAIDGCDNLVTTDLLKVSFYKYCHCTVKPQICPRCRSMNHCELQCKWCGKSGGCHTVKSQNDTGIIECFRKWDKLRTQYPHITPEIAKMATHWGKFLEMYNMFSPSWRFLEKNSFLRRFLYSEMRNMKLIKVSYSTSYIVSHAISKILFFWLKRISFTRMLVCKLLSDQKHCELFQRSYCERRVPFYQQKMMRMTTRYLIANLAHLHQLSNNYKKIDDKINKIFYCSPEV
jgi:hypothetical protein